MPKSPSEWDQAYAAARVFFDSGQPDCELQGRRGLELIRQPWGWTVIIVAELYIGGQSSPGIDD
jgi:hypothetical protein